MLFSGLISTGIPRYRPYEAQHAVQAIEPLSVARGCIHLRHIYILGLAGRFMRWFGYRPDKVQVS